MNRKVETLQLKGADAYDFACALFRPSDEMTKRTQNSLDTVNNSVSINRIENGFEAEIDGLDLSFLDEVSNKISINVNITMCVNVIDKVYNSNDSNHNSYTLEIRKNIIYNNLDTDELPMVAA